jgi:DNA-directed RNA polymerase specialized sigma subunit
MAVLPVNEKKDLSAAKAKDVELWKQWKETGSKEHLGQLVKQLSPVIYSEVNRVSGTLPPSALSAEAKKWAIKALHTYDPVRGTALSTHVMNYLPKVRRLNYKYQNAVRLPEDMHLKFHEYDRTAGQLADQLNRDPTDDELAKALGWTKGKTVKFKSSLYADLIESSSERPSEFTEFNDNAILMQHILGQLTTEERFILDHTKDMSAGDIAKKLGVNINRYNYLKKKLTDKIYKIKVDIGM